MALYNIPKYMHFEIPPELVQELASHDNVVGIKDSSGDTALFGRYLQAQGDRFGVLTGSGSQLAAALAEGGAGGILAVALFAPTLACGIRDAAAAGDAAAAAAAQARLALTARDIVAAHGVPWREGGARSRGPVRRTVPAAAAAGGRGGATGGGDVAHGRRRDGGRR